MKSSICVALFFILSLLAFSPARASHMVGGVMTYVYLGDSVSAGITYQNYQVSLSIYEDCLNGTPAAIAEDNPAFFGAFSAAVGYPLYQMDTSIYNSSSITLPAVYANACGESVSALSLCTLQKTFTQRYAFPPSTYGYVIAYQRCCRNAGIVNILDPANIGSTFFCTIPPTTITNNSAVFKTEPPQIACLNSPFYYDNSATDADGDSLSYGFCAGLNGANFSNAKPVPTAPPYDSIPYVPPYSSQIPLTGSPNLTIDPVTGVITGYPTLIGRYQIGVYCNEWRAGVLINTVRREFEVMILPCNLSVFTPAAGPDTIIMVGSTVNFYSSAAVSYTWSPGTFLSSTTIANPVGTFPTPGNYTYTIDEVNDSGCHGEDILQIQVLDYSDFIVPTAFSPNGDGLNDYLAPLSVLGSTLISFKVFNRNGNLVYNGAPDDIGWDGNYKGVRQDIGTYYWELLYNDSNGITRNMKGSVTLIR